MKFTYAAGDRPLEGYTINHGLGFGGFGEVYHAVSDGGKEVALKLVLRYLNIELRGVRQCLNLKHPNLVTLFDIRQGTSGENWVVMEYVAGERLDQAIDRHPLGMPLDESLAWMRGICAGLAYLHEHDIVHRDLKPGNLFMESGLVKIGDYGLSKFISADHRSGQTQSIGTVHYMAPEIGGGRYGKEVDLYALGVILYEMLTGRTPFDGNSPAEILIKHLTAEPDLGSVPQRLRPVVARLLRKDPGQRHGSATSLMIDLDERLRETTAEPVESPSRHSPARPRETAPQVADAQAPAARAGIPSATVPLGSQRFPMPGAGVIDSGQQQVDEATLVREQVRITVGFALAVVGGIGFGFLAYKALHDSAYTATGRGKHLVWDLGTPGVGFLSASLILYLVCRGSHYAKAWGTWVVILMGLGVGCTIMAAWDWFADHAPQDTAAFFVTCAIVLATWGITGRLLHLRWRLKQLRTNNRES